MRRLVVVVALALAACGPPPNRFAAEPTPVVLTDKERSEIAAGVRPMPAGPVATQVAPKSPDWRFETMKREPLSPDLGSGTFYRDRRTGECFLRVDGSTSLAVVQRSMCNG